ncbi:Cysteine/O-acetylserine efflux protein [Bacillus rhizoplanae]|uniref:Cysteine/O-acetylserine efflux protein n=1 Tax=Bacillus rhizoplanae TaxID=2880966 RepID=A0ABN8A1G9_9BACI|nr:LysE family translocator [Bacillus rhizoplanae]CAG9614878.1 Cysteine/O-acetylserine efflux protein [Bacillus rhizoplanae]
MNITSFLIYCFIITFTPGPTNIVILSTTHHYGVKSALKYTYGSTIALFILLALSAFLNTILATWIPKILLLMQIVGTIYMLYLAYQIYKADNSSESKNTTGNFTTGFVMQFLNPKVVLFTLTVIPSFILPYYDAFLPISLSVLAITIIGFCAFVMWVLFGAIFKQFLQKHKKIVNVIMALCLVYAALMIWV